MSSKNRMVFYVSRDGEFFSTLWYVIVNKKGDIYLMSRMMGGIFKVSIHKSGQCHVALTTEHIKQASDNTQSDIDRYFDKWNNMVINDTSNIIPLYQIRIPSTELHHQRYIDHNPSGKTNIKLNQEEIAVITLMKIPRIINGHPATNIVSMNNNGTKTIMANKIEHYDGTYIALCYTVVPISDDLNIYKEKQKIINAVKERGTIIEPQNCLGYFATSDLGLRQVVEILPY